MSGNGDGVDENEREQDAGRASLTKPIGEPMRAAKHITETMARCLPKRIATSLPRILEGMGDDRGEPAHGGSNDDPEIHVRKAQSSKQ